MNEEQMMLIQQMLAEMGQGADPGQRSVGMSALSKAASLGSTGFALGGPIGGALGGAAGAVIGAVSADNNKKAMQRREAAYSKARSAARLNNYPTTGVDGSVTYYRNGGIMRKYANGGIQPISTGGKVYGPSHEEGGVQVEVEGGEVLNQTPEMDVWFSNRLKTAKGNTFAEAAESLLKEKERYENQLNVKSQTVRNTALRNLEKVNAKLDALTAEQMSTQTEKGLPIDGEKDSVGIRKAANGATFSRIAPYLDNVVNTVVTAATPQVATPALEDPIQLDTDYNVADQIAEERRGLNQIQRNLARNTSNSAVARNNMLAASASSLARRNQIYGQKERMETQAENQERLTNAQINARNIERVNRTREQEVGRTDQILGNVSANAANAVDDFITQETEDRLMMRDQATLELLKKKYQDLGLWDRNMSGAFEQFISGAIDYDTFKGLMNRAFPDNLDRLPTRMGTVQRNNPRF